MKKLTYKLKALWNILTAPASWYCTFSKEDAPFVEADMLHSDAKIPFKTYEEDYCYDCVAVSEEDEKR